MRFPASHQTGRALSLSFIEERWTECPSGGVSHVSPTFQRRRRGGNYDAVCYDEDVTTDHPRMVRSKADFIDLSTHKTRHPASLVSFRTRDQKHACRIFMTSFFLFYLLVTPKRSRGATRLDFLSGVVHARLWEVWGSRESFDACKASNSQNLLLSFFPPARMCVQLCVV